MTTCEYCGKALRRGDTVHGIKHGSLAPSGFVPAKDAAVTVLCNDCSQKVYRLVYASLDTGKLAYPTIFKMYTELTTLMKNGYKLIFAISKLPAEEQHALRHLVESCKSSR
jgi:hypothetical protein